MLGKKTLFFMMGSLWFTQAIAQTPEGVWTTIDDNTGKKRAIINLQVSDGVLNGTIVKVFPQPGDTKVCDKCPGEFKNQPVKGLKVIWGLQDKGKGVWDGGHILDPKNGKVYSAKMTLQDNKLAVRGYLGFAALGRTQVWQRK